MTVSAYFRTAGKVPCLRIDGHDVDHADDGPAPARLLGQYIPHGLETIANGSANLRIQMQRRTAGPVEDITEHGARRLDGRTAN